MKTKNRLIILQAIFGAWLICWVLSFILENSALFWASLIAVLAASGVVLCWGQIKINKRRK